MSITHILLLQLHIQKKRQPNDLVLVYNILWQKQHLK